MNLKDYDILRVSLQLTGEDKAQKLHIPRESTISALKWYFLLYLSQDPELFIFSDSNSQEISFASPKKVYDAFPLQDHNIICFSYRPKSQQTPFDVNLRFGSKGKLSLKSASLEENYVNSLITLYFGGSQKESKRIKLNRINENTFNVTMDSHAGFGVCKASIIRSKKEQEISIFYTKYFRVFHSKIIACSINYEASMNLLVESAPHQNHELFIEAIGHGKNAEFKSIQRIYHYIYKNKVKALKTRLQPIGCSIIDRIWELEKWDQKTLSHHKFFFDGIELSRTSDLIGLNVKTREDNPISVEQSSSYKFESTLPEFDMAKSFRRLDIQTSKIKFQKNVSILILLYPSQCVADAIEKIGQNIKINPNFIEIYDSDGNKLSPSHAIQELKGDTFQFKIVEVGSKPFKFIYLNKEYKCIINPEETVKQFISKICKENMIKAKNIWIRNTNGVFEIIPKYTNMLKSITLVNEIYLDDRLNVSVHYHDKKGNKRINFNVPKYSSVEYVRNICGITSSDLKNCKLLTYNPEKPDEHFPLDEESPIVHYCAIHSSNVDIFGERNEKPQSSIIRKSSQNLIEIHQKFSIFTEGGLVEVEEIANYDSVISDIIKGFCQKDLNLTGIDEKKSLIFFKGEIKEISQTLKEVVGHNKDIPIQIYPPDSYLFDINGEKQYLIMDYTMKISDACEMIGKKIGKSPLMIKIFASGIEIPLLTPMAHYHSGTCFQTIVLDNVTYPIHYKEVTENFNINEKTIILDLIKTCCELVKKVDKKKEVKPFDIRIQVNKKVLPKETDRLVLKEFNETKCDVSIETLDKFGFGNSDGNMLSLHFSNDDKVGFVLDSYLEKVRVPEEEKECFILTYNGFPMNANDQLSKYPQDDGICYMITAKQDLANCIIHLPGDKNIELMLSTDTIFYDVKEYFGKMYEVEDPDNVVLTTNDGEELDENDSPTHGMEFTVSFTCDYTAPPPDDIPPGMFKCLFFDNKNDAKFELILNDSCTCNESKVMIADYYKNLDERDLDPEDVNVYHDRRELDPDVILKSTRHSDDDIFYVNYTNKDEYNFFRSHSKSRFFE